MSNVPLWPTTDRRLANHEGKQRARAQNPVRGDDGACVTYEHEGDTRMRRRTNARTRGARWSTSRRTPARWRRSSTVSPTARPAADQNRQRRARSSTGGSGRLRLNGRQRRAAAKPPASRGVLRCSRKARADSHHAVTERFLAARNSLI